MSDGGKSKQYLSIARVTVEALSPISIANGGEDGTAEAPLVRDPNGLPMLPATSIAGILKDTLDLETADRLLGYQKEQDGKRSAITISDALIHWSDDKPRDGLLLGAENPGSDPLARCFRKDAPIIREHVRISEHGVVDGDGKFDRAAIPAGARFTFEMSARHADGERPLEPLIRQLRTGLHIGGAVRSGYGSLRCFAIGDECVDLKTDQNRMRELSDADLSTSILRTELVPESDGKAHVFRCKCDGPLMIGGASADKNIDSAPFREHCVIWENGTGRLDGRYVIPASSIKGPLRHRTAYHLRKAGRDGERVAELFGSAREGQKGNAGRLRFYDAQVSSDTKTIQVPHVGIDRFTAGARQGVLFVNEMLWKPKFQIAIEWLDETDLDPALRSAFNLALEDLKNGHLSIGADWGDGAGIVKCVGVTDVAA